MLVIVAERFILDVVEEYEGEHPISVSTDGGGSWYPPSQQACKFLKLE